MPPVVDTMVLSYLISTAGHAQAQNELHPHRVKTILQLVHEGAAEFGNEDVVGFTQLQHGEWVCKRYSFLALLQMARSVQESLGELGVPPARDGQSICLLCPTGLDFLLAWIALMMMGYGVMLVAPQCSPPAVQHLYTSTNSQHLVYHAKYRDLAQQALSSSPSALVELPGAPARPDLDSGTEPPQVAPESVSHIFHTSGTSGVPKPIPQTHLQSVAVLPRRALPSYLQPDGQSRMPPAEAAAFTTTPLFHGGVSDLLRAWMARSVVYFYPTSDIPVTAANVVGAVASCNAAAQALPGRSLSTEQQKERAERFQVSAFLSVPYILSVLAEDPAGPAMEMLRGLDFVSTGGAPLDTAIGDCMVQQGVRLVSRLGSSECGFLLSSHRDYETEKDWELLRNDSPYAEALNFEPVDGPHRFEMVVTNEWSSKTKSNRPDGAYATGDLYEKHPDKPNVWRYVGRGDDVLVMSNGEKASPGPIETILRSSPLLADALVVGSDRPQLGLLLFPRDPSAHGDVLEILAGELKQANDASPSYAQISRDMCLIVTDPERIGALPKSSKGTIQRGVAYDVFASEISQLYGSVAHSSELPRRSLAEIRSWLRSAVLEVAAGPDASLEEDTDLFTWGVDSVKATRIRSSIQRSINVGEKPLPGNIVFEQPTIARLSEYVFARQEGQEASEDTRETTLQLMESLAAELGTFDQSTAMKMEQADVGEGDLLLTGATGSLGSHLLHQLCQSDSRFTRVVCLVRSADDDSARERVLHALERRNLAIDQSKLVALAGDVSTSHLGLDRQVYAGIVRSVTAIIHAAWPVHFASSLVSFKPQIIGVHNLIDLSRSSSQRSRFYFCSSIASVLGKTYEHAVTESPSEDPRDAVAIGYAQSKWVSERVITLASHMPEIEGRLHILRIGQLCGDTVTGHWNEKEGWPLLIRTAETVGALPDLTERPSWLPVDLAAKTIIDVLQSHATRLVYHVAHPMPVVWQEVLAGIRQSGLQFHALPPAEWAQQLDKDLPKDDPSRQMLAMWQAAYGKSATKQEDHRVQTDATLQVSETLRAISPISTLDVERMVMAWRASGFLRGDTVKC